MPKQKHGDFKPERHGPSEAELTQSVTVRDGIRYTVLKPMPASGCEFAETWRKMPMATRSLY
jgi:hypothetical protein